MLAVSTLTCLPLLFFKVGNFCTSGRFLVAPVSYPLILGLDWLRGLRAVWDFGHDRITVFRGSGCFNLSVVEATASDLQKLLGQAETNTVRAEGKAAHADLVESLDQLGPQASALVRKQPKRYKNSKSTAKSVPIQGLTAAARTHCADSLTGQPQCVMLSAAPSPAQQPTLEAACGGPCISKSPHSLLRISHCSPNQHKVEKWLATAQQQGVHPKVVQLVVKYRGLFLDELPDGLPPPRAFDMTIATVPNATVYQKAAVHVLEGYLRKKWIQTSCSPYAAPVVLVPKNGDPPGSPGSSLVVDCRPLNAITIAQGTPSTFQAIMSSIFFDMLGQGALIYMDDILVYTATFEEHLRLARQCVGRLLQHKMYPELAIRNFAAQSIGYLRHRVGADSIYPSTGNVSATVLWPTELANETQVRQLLGTVNYFMGPQFAVLARPLQQLLKQKAFFRWTAAHSSAVQALKDHLIH
ncbi:hypothetical protein Esti_003088 [Eimeria stiedai]